MEIEIGEIIRLIAAILGTGGLTSLLYYKTRKKKMDLKNDSVAIVQLERVLHHIQEEQEKDRRTIEKLERSVNKLTIAIEQIKYCKYTGVCPVRLKLIEDSQQNDTKSATDI